MNQIPQQGIVGSAALREAAAGEFSQVLALVRAALSAKLGFTRPEEAWRVDVEAMYADRAVIRREGRFWSYPYTLSEDNQVQLGEAQEVVEQYVPVKLREAAEAETFLEAKQSDGSEWEVTIIRAGLSHNKTFYPDAVLRESVALFDGARVFAKPDVMHIKGEGKDVNRIAGWLTKPRFVAGSKTDSGRINATFHFAAGAAALRDTVTDAWRRGKKDLVGFSIDAEGTAKPARAMREAKSITKVNSVDLIVDPSAGGGLVRLVEAADTEQENDMSLKTKMLESIKEKAPEVFAEIDVATITDDELTQRYAEAMSTGASPVVATGVTTEQLNEGLRMIEAKSNAKARVDAAPLPPAAKDRVWAQVQAAASFTEAAVDGAIKTEREYLAKFSESGKVSLGEFDVSVEDRSAKMGDMLDAFFDPSHKDHRKVQSFKEAYIEMTGDRRVTGRIQDMDRTRLAESLGGTFRESMDSSTLANVLGNAITRRLVADYRTPNVYDAWRPVVSVVPISDFRTQERTRFGGYGDIPAVAQGAAYQALTSPTDEKATYAISKRGGTEDITLEMIKNDDVGAIRRIPVSLSRAAKRTLAKFVFDFVRTNPTLYDSVAFFHATHGNLGAAALDASSLAARRLAMLKQTEAGSADRLGIGPRYLVVAVDLQETAVNLFNRNTNLDKTFVNEMSLTIIPVWYWEDTNDWALAADPMDIPGIEIGFLDGNEEPELFVQDNPTVGSMFTNDKVTYKIRHIFGGNVVDFRGWDKSVVA